MKSASLVSVALELSDRLHFLKTRQSELKVRLDALPKNRSDGVYALWRLGGQLFEISNEITFLEGLIGKIRCDKK